jgi:hypothetical protein
MINLAATSARGACLALAFASAIVTGPMASADLVVGGSIHGIVSAPVPVGLTGSSLPLLQTLVSAEIVSNSSNAIVFSSYAGAVGPKLTSGRLYYLEVLSGPLEGERYDLDTAGTLSAGNGTVLLNLARSSNSTSNSLAAGSLVGARAAIRAHVRLSDLPGWFTPELVGHDLPAEADGVQVFTQGALRPFYLQPDGTWREPGKTVDESGRVIAPDTSVLFQIRSSAKTWMQSGIVRENAFRKNLVTGFQSFASGYPVALSPVELAAFVDASLPRGTRWTGANNPGQADRFQTWDRSIGDYQLYYLRSDGSSWFQPGKSANYASQRIIPALNLVLLRRSNPDPGYLIIPPLVP